MSTTASNSAAAGPMRSLACRMKWLPRWRKPAAATGPRAPKAKATFKAAVIVAVATAAAVVVTVAAAIAAVAAVVAEAAAVEAAAAAEAAAVVAAAAGVAAAVGATATGASLLAGTKPGPGVSRSQTSSQFSGSKFAPG